MLIVLGHFLHGVPLVWVLDSFLSILNALDSWVKNVVEHWWYKCQLEHKNVFVWQLWSTVESSENLIWSEFVGVMIRVSLDSEGDLSAG